MAGAAGEEDGAALAVSTEQVLANKEVKLRGSERYRSLLSRMKGGSHVVIWGPFGPSREGQGGGSHPSSVSKEKEGQGSVPTHKKNGRTAIHMEEVHTHANKNHTMCRERKRKINKGREKPKIGKKVKEKHLPSLLFFLEKKLLLLGV